MESKGLLDIEDLVSIECFHSKHFYRGKLGGVNYFQMVDSTFHQIFQSSFTTLAPVQ